MTRIVMILVLGAAAILPTWSVANETNVTLSRQEIRSMPMVERPSRPGHFFGNFVRRVHHRRG